VVLGLVQVGVVAYWFAVGTGRGCRLHRRSRGICQGTFTFMTTIKRWYNAALVWAFLRLGTKLFRVVAVNRGDGDAVCAIHFAASERDMNISMRDYVDSLDKHGTQ
jgi:hypothetical protein